MNDEGARQGAPDQQLSRRSEPSNEIGTPAPAIVITFPLESPPSIALVWDSDEDDWRMTHWLDANPAYAQVVYRACQLAEELAA